MMKLKGFTTLAAMACLLFLVILAALGISKIQENLFWQNKNIEQIKLVESFRKHCLSVMEAAQDSNEVNIDWKELMNQFSLPDNTKADFEDLSGRFDLNTLMYFLLQEKTLTATLKKSAADLQAYRVDKGPFVNLDGYKEYVNDEALKRIYRVTSLININTVDEMMLEKFVAIRMANEQEGTNLRATVKFVRANKQIIDAQNLDMILGNNKDTLGPLITIVPEINVNVAEVEVLTTLLKYSSWNIAAADTKIATIIALRKSAPLTMEQLRNLLALDKKHMIYQFLGVESRFFQINYETGDRVYQVIYYNDTLDDNKAHYRILSQGWAS